MSTTGSPLRLDALIRVSQRAGREGESFRSPEQQLDICRRCVDGLGASIAAVHEAIDVSGKSMIRPDIDAALARIRAGLTDGVVVAWLDRFSRAPVDQALAVYRDIAAAGGQVVAADMAGIDPRDPTGELALTVMLGVNRMQWRRIAERWDMSRADAIRAGKAIGRAPYGYRFADPTPREGGRGVLDSRLVVHPGEALIVRELFERRSGGATWLELARWMDEVSPRSSGLSWARNSVRELVCRRTYLGEVRHGRHVNADAHEPIVDAGLWRRAQGAPGRRTPRGSYLLSGLARCAGCGRRLRGNSQGARGYRIYVCECRDCPSRPTVSVNRVEAEVARQFFERLAEFHVRAGDDGDAVAAAAAVEERRGAVERLAAVVPSHPSAVAAHQKALQAAEADLEAAEDRLHELMAATGGDADARDLSGDWPQMTLGERREVLRAGVDVVLVRRASSRRWPHGPIAERVLVLWRGQAPAELMGGSVGPLRSWTWDDDPRSLRSAAA